LFTALRPTYAPPSSVLSLPSLSVSTLSLLFLLAPLIVSCRERSFSHPRSNVQLAQTAPVVILVALSSITLRHNAVYVTLRAQDTNGTYSILILKAVTILVTLQPFLFGLILLAHRLFGFGAASLAVGLLLALYTIYTLYAQHGPRSPKHLSLATRQGLAAFELGACDGSFSAEDASRNVSRNSLVGRRSMASLFDLLETAGFSSTRVESKPALPLESEVVDPFAYGQRAARLHSDAPPNLPTLYFDAAALKSDETMYPPALISTRPLLILPRDALSQDEARDLLDLHGIRATWEEAPELHLLPGIKLSASRGGPSVEMSQNGQ
jgi:hypothetical protein